MKNKEQLFKEMMDFGYTQQQLDDIIDGMSPDYYDMLIELIVEGSDDTYLEEIEGKLKAATDQPGKDVVVDEALTKLFGDQMQSKKEETFVTLLEEMFEKGKKMRELYQKYQQGDPETVKQMEEIMKTDEYKQFKDELTAAAQSE